MIFVVVVVFCWCRQLSISSNKMSYSRSYMYSEAFYVTLTRLYKQLRFSRLDSLQRNDIDMGSDYFPQSLC